MVQRTNPPPYGTYEKKSDSWVKSSEYFLDDGNLIILVKNTLYSVWKTSFCRHSKHFEHKLAVDRYTWSKSVADGTDDDHPMRLELVQPRDFDCLLSVIYPPVFGEYKANSAPQWRAILDLSTRWEFNDIRQLAIKQLDGHEIEPIEKIAIQHKYQIPRQWAYKAYIDVCSRPSPPTKDEAEKVGMETAILINQAREKLEKSGRNKPKDVARVVCYIFELTDPAETSCSPQ